MRIGVIGVGRMGRAVAERLAERGHALALWNRSPEKARGIAGAEVLASPADVVAKADVVLSVLANDAAIEAVYFGEGGLCAADLSGSVVVEMCTTLPERTQALERAVTERGGLFLECPMGGTIGPARDGQLLGLAGGSAAAFDAARPVLEQLTRRLEHLGPVGTGTAMKLAINLPLMVYWSAVGEAAGLALSAGIPSERAFDILSDSSGAIGAAKRRVPALRRLIETGQAGEPMFDLENGAKDMRLMEALAAETGLPAPTLAAARAKAERALAGGWSGYDASLFGMYDLRERD